MTSNPSVKFEPDTCQVTVQLLSSLEDTKMEKHTLAPPAHSHALKLAISGALYLCHAVMGLGIDFLGSSLLEMRNKYQTDIPTISVVFTVNTGSFMVGAFLGGVVFRWVNRQLATAALVCLMGIGLICQGQAAELWAFLAATAAFGFGCGGFETAQVVWIIEMWGDKAEPYIQAQHFAYAIGAFVSPLLVKPFLSVDEGQEEEQVVANSTGIDGSLPAPAPTGSPTLYIPFTIGGVVAFSGAAALLILYCIEPYTKKKRAAEGASGPATSKCRKWTLVFLSGAFLCFYVGMEVGTCQFIATFAHFIDLRLSKPDGALILSGVTGAFTLGRGLGVPLVILLSPETLLLGSLVLVAIGNTILILWANTSLYMLWAGAVTLGIGFSTVFPSFYGYLEKHLKITDFVGGILIEMGWIAVSVYPFIVGPNIEAHPFVMTYTNYFSLGMCSLLLAILFFITKSRTDKNSSDL